MISRRAFVTAVAGGVVLTPLAAGAQQPTGKISRIGVLFPVEPPDDPNVTAFRKALRDLGYVEGQSVTVEYQHADGRTDGFPDLIAELVRLKVDVMIVGSVPAARAAQRATSTIPVSSSSAIPSEPASWGASRGQAEI
jgi:putative tryptophan/tyrosine transport system substrate-binding protein